MEAKAIEAMRAAGGSARLVRSKGTLAPRTNPAAHPAPKYTNDLNSVFPDTISGTIMPSAKPQTLLFNIPFTLAASADKIRSRAKGPSNSAPSIFSDAQSLKFLAITVEGMLSITLSLADKKAILGLEIPIFFKKF